MQILKFIMMKLILLKQTNQMEAQALKLNKIDRVL